MLEIKNLVKNYGKFTAVNDLSFKIKKGTIFGFVGPNGAGKTTTMKIMAGLLKATSGDIILDGESLLKNQQLIKDKFGYMPDFFGVYDNLKVTEYMDFYAGAYYIPYEEREKLIDRLLELVKLSHKKEFYVDSLSRGMKQRLCLARSLIHDPEILILDEPASGLDPRARIEMKEILKTLGSMGKTIIISSHILPELSEMCTEIGIIDNGKMRAKGSVADIMRLLKKKRVIEIVPFEKNENLVGFLKENKNVIDVIENTTSVEISFGGEDEDLSNLLSSLITNGIKLLSFKEKTGDLEEIFMEVTGGVANNA